MSGSFGGLGGHVMQRRGVRVGCCEERAEVQRPVDALAELGQGLNRNWNIDPQVFCVGETFFVVS